MADLSQWSPADVARYRAILRERAEQIRLNPLIQVRMDESDLVQETWTRAVQSAEPCHGSSDGERLAWLFKILKNVVVDAYRTHHADCRDVEKEQQLIKELDDSTVSFLRNVPGKEPTPVEEVIRKEKQQRLAAAIAQLPEKQRIVVQMIAIDRNTYAETANALALTDSAVAGLYRRGIEQVHKKLQNEQES